MQCPRHHLLITKFIVSIVVRTLRTSQYHWLYEMIWNWYRFLNWLRKVKLPFYERIVPFRRMFDECTYQKLFLETESKHKNEKRKEEKKNKYILRRISHRRNEFGNYIAIFTLSSLGHTSMEFYVLCCLYKSLKTSMHKAHAIGTLTCNRRLSTHCS